MEDLKPPVKSKTAKPRKSNFEKTLAGLISVALDRVKKAAPADRAPIIGEVTEIVIYELGRFLTASLDDPKKIERLAVSILAELLEHADEMEAGR